MKDKKAYKKLILKLVVSILLIVYILFKVNKKGLLQNLALINTAYVPLIIFFILLNYIISSYRWKQLLLSKNSDKASFGYLTVLYFVGSFFNNFMPTSIGGDVYKIFKLSKKIGDSSNAFTSTFMERFTGVLILCLFTLISFINKLKLWLIPLICLFIIGIISGLYILKRFSKKIKFFGKVYESLNAYKDNKKILLSALILSLIVQLASILTQYTIFIALGLKISFLYALFAFPVITLATFFVPSLNGIGVQDALYIQFLGFVGISSELALAGSVLYHLFRLGVSLIGGALYAMGKAD
jgi:glycosyltransferase 2 family protein